MKLYELLNLLQKFDGESSAIEALDSIEPELKEAREKEFLVDDPNLKEPVL